MRQTADFEHLGLFYEDSRQYLAATQEFIEDGLEIGEPVLVSVPGHKHRSMRARLNGLGDRVEFWNMNELGRNPGRIIPAVHDWVQRQDAPRCRFIGEPIWPGRTSTELIEATRHEALINLAFAACNATILCPYDVPGLDEHVLADAERTHPLLVRDGCTCLSDHYTDPVELWRAAEWPIDAPDGPVAEAPSTLDLVEIRDFARCELARLGVRGLAVDDLVLAIDEAATNAMLHGSGTARVRIWRQGPHVVCEISDGGTFDEPLAGRRRPGLDWTSGRGVWLMNQVCDLVEVRPTEQGTVVRLHRDVDRDDATPAGPGGSTARVPNGAPPSASPTRNGHSAPGTGPRRTTPDAYTSSSPAGAGGPL
jgi:anti-sigma regulatory factor (Ser/Thr protein kinase)